MLALKTDGTALQPDANASPVGRSEAITRPEAPGELAEQIFRLVAEEIRLAWPSAAPQTAAAALEGFRERWEQRLPGAVLCEDSIHRALALAEFANYGSVPVLPARDPWEDTAGILQRLLTGLSVLFFSRLLAMPLTYGLPLRPWVFYVGCAVYISFTTALLIVDHSTRRAQEAARQMNQSMLLSRQQKQIFESALTHLHRLIGL